MKKIVLSFAITMAFCNLSLANNKINVQNECLKTDCGRISAIMCEIYEEMNDCCLDSSDYNEIYTYFYDKCILAS